jgi:hypothetical protein
VAIRIDSTWTIKVCAGVCQCGSSARATVNTTSMRRPPARVAVAAENGNNFNDLRAERAISPIV